MKSLVQVTWSELKALSQQKRIKFQVRETLNAFEVSLTEGELTWWTPVYKPPASPEMDDGTYNEEEYNDWLVEKLQHKGPIEPKTDDGRPMVQPVTLDRGIWHWFTSDGDSPTVKGAGPAFELFANSEGNQTVEWQFKDWVEMAGGVCIYENAKRGDYISFEVAMPATQATSTPGTGNANKVPVPGGNMFVPAAGDGAWTINLSSSDAVPVIASGSNGYWHWSWPDTGVGVVSPSIPAKGSYFLFDFSIDPATRFMPRVRILGSHVLTFTPDNVHPTDILPHWKMRMTLHHGPGTHEVDMVWYLVTARKDTK